MGCLWLLECILVAICGALLMRPALAGWREVLREPRWRCLRVAFLASPAMFLAMLPVAEAFVQSQRWLPAGLWMWTQTTAGIGWYLLPPLAACWWRLPPREGEPFSYLRTASTATVIFMGNSAVGGILFVVYDWLH